MTARPLHPKGQQQEDRMFHGDKVAGTAIAVIDGDGGVEYDDVVAAVEDVGGDDSDEDGDDQLADAAEED